MMTSEQLLPTSEQLAAEYAQTGRDDLLSELFKRHNDSLLYQLSWRQRDKYLVSEASQITWIKCWKYGRTYNGTSKFFTWLLKIAHNTLTDLERKEQLRDAISSPLLDAGLVAFRNDDESDPSDNSEARNRVASKLRRLGSNLRRIVYLGDLRGNSYRAVANRVGIPIGTVKSRRHRAIAIMRRELAERERLPKEMRKELSR